MQHKHTQKNVKKPLPKCQDKILDSKGYAICIHNLEAPGYCTNPCPYRLTTSASIDKCNTFLKKLNEGVFQQKRFILSLKHAFSRRVTLNIEVEGAASL